MARRSNIAVAATAIVVAAVIFFICLYCVHLFWSVTNTACTSDDEIEDNQQGTFFITVQMNPHAVCKLRDSPTSTNISALPGCKAVYQNIKLNWIIDHFFPWDGKYGLKPCIEYLSLTRMCNGTTPCPFDCCAICTTFHAGDYQDELAKYWLDPINSNQHQRWQTEWTHVQPCFQLAQDITVTNYSGIPSVLYAKEILRLYKTNNINTTLAQHNIIPSDLKSYLLKDVQNALSSKVILGCRLSHLDCVLTRIGLCFNYTSSLIPTLIDCPDFKGRPLPWVSFDYSFDGAYTEDGFVCNCTYVKYYGYGRD